MRIRTALLFTASLMTQEIFAGPALSDISPNQPFCAQSQDLWIMLYRRKDPTDQTLYLNLQVQLHGQIFRAGLICDVKASNHVHCAVECDGGQGELFANPESSSHLFFQNKGIHVSGACDPVDQPVVWEPGETPEDLQMVACP